MGVFLAAAAGSETLDWVDKLLIGFHVAVMAVYLVGGLWIKIPIHRAQRAIPPAQAAAVGQRVGLDFTYLSWFAFVTVGISGYVLLARADDLDLLSPYTFFLDHGLLDTKYGWALFAMIAFWAMLVICGLVMTVVFRPRLAGKLQPTDPADLLEPFQKRLGSAVFWIDVLAWANLVFASGAFAAGLIIGLEHTVERVAT